MSILGSDWILDAEKELGTGIGETGVFLSKLSKKDFLLEFGKYGGFMYIFTAFQ